MSSENIVPCFPSVTGPVEDQPPGRFSYRSENFCTRFLLIRCRLERGETLRGQLVKLERECCLSHEKKMVDLIAI